MNRLLAICGTCVLVLAAAAPGSASPKHAALQPNILIFLADDLGWRDVPWHGCEYSMPNLDSLAKQSLRLESHYVHPLCSPTRAALLSGRYASRFGCTAPQNERVFPFDTITFPVALKSLGYTTGLIGKWHLGSLPEWGPNRFGFDESFGSLAGGMGPFDHHYKRGPFTNALHRNGKLIEEPGHITDLIAREAVKFLEHQKAGPFFLYVPFTAVHIPIDEPKQWLDKNAHVEEGGERLHAACATHMDWAIGEILAALDKTGRRGNTLILFFSDNGGHGPIKNNDPKYPGTYPALKVGRDNAPLRGLKAGVYEGGIRTPAIVSWPEHLQPGVSDEPLHACDWFPTLATMAGYQPPRDLRWDGIDIWPRLTGAAVSGEPRTLYCLGAKRREQIARRGPWKLIANKNGPAELYNLTDDLGETKNVADQNPGIVADLKRRIDEISARDNECKVPGSHAAE